MCLFPPRPQYISLNISGHSSVCWSLVSSPRHQDLPEKEAYFPQAGKQRRGVGHPKRLIRRPRIPQRMPLRHQYCIKNSTWTSPLLSGRHLHWYHLTPRHRNTHRPTPHAQVPSSYHNSEVREDPGNSSFTSYFLISTPVLTPALAIDYHSPPLRSRFLSTQHLVVPDELESLISKRSTTVPSPIQPWRL